MNFSQSKRKRIDSSGILSFSDEEIQENYQSVLSEIRQNIAVEENCLEYGTFALEKVVKYTPVEDLENALFKIVCPALKDTFLVMINGMTDLKNNVFNQTQTNPEDAIPFLSQSCIVITKAFSTSCEALLKLAKVKYSDVQTLFVTLLHILPAAETFVNTCTENTLINLEIFKNEMLELRRKYLVLLTNKSIVFDCNNEKDVDELQNILNNLTVSVISNHIPELEKEVYKTIILMIESYECLQARYNGSTLITHLCSELMKEVSNGIEKRKFANLLPCNWFLKIIIKVSKMLSVFDHDCLEYLTKLLINLFSLTPSNLLAYEFSQKEVEEIFRHLTMGATPFLSGIVSKRQFPKIVNIAIMSEQDSNSYGCLLLLLAILSKATDPALRKLYFEEDCNILKLCFLCFGKCSSGIREGKFFAPEPMHSNNEILKKDLFDHVLKSLIAFAVRLTADEFNVAKTIIMQNVMQPETLPAILACDLFCGIVRIAEPVVGHSLVEALIGMLMLIENPDCCPESVHLTWLLQRLLPLCEREFIDNLIVILPPSEHPQIWRNLSLGPNHQRAAYDSYLSTINKWLNSSGGDVLDILSLEALAKVLQDGHTDKNLLVFVNKLLDECGESIYCERFMRVLVRLGASLASPDSIRQSRDTIAKIIKIATAPGNHPSVKLATLWEIVEKFDAHSNLKSLGLDWSIAHTFQCVLASDSPAVQMEGWRCFLKFAQTTQHPALIKTIAGPGTPFHRKFVSILKNGLPVAPAVANVGNASDARSTNDPHIGRKDTAKILKQVESDISCLARNYQLMDPKQLSCLRSLCQRILTELPQ